MKIQWHLITNTYWKLLHGRNLVDVKNYDKNNTKLTHVWHQLNHKDLLKVIAT
jgi:hypothetical protein